MAVESFPDVEFPPPGTGAVVVREGPLPGGRWRNRSVLTDRYPDASLLDDPVDTDGMFVLWYTDVDDEGRDLITMNPVIARGAQRMWYVVLPEPRADRPAVSLVGFATGHLPPGTIVTDPVFFSMPVRNDEQAGAIRWWYEEAVVDQIFVAPDWRQQGIASELIYATNAWQALHGHPVDLRSDGRRTELGMHFEAGNRFPQRFAPVTEVSPPMDPLGPSR